MNDSARPRPSRAKILAAFAAVYIIWGSTYFAIGVAVETIPPFLMAAARFLVSGVILYVIARARSAERPSLLHWKNAAIVGAFLLVGGNGAVVWAEQFVPTGLTALLVSILPFWIVMIEWVLPGGRRPSLGIAAGLFLGIIGLVYLIGPSSITGGDAGPVPLAGAVVLILGSLSWALGSLYSKKTSLPGPIMAIGMEMLTGGVLLLLIAIIRGEPWGFDVRSVSIDSWLGLAYLTTFGSLIAFTAFIWLLGVAAPARVATYAYVNPVVAVLLGWAIGGEQITIRTLIAGGIIISAVALITTARSSDDQPAPED